MHQSLTNCLNSIRNILQNVIVYPSACTEMYQDVLDDPDSGYGAICLLQKENPVIANVLIDYFEIHKLSM